MKRFCLRCAAFVWIFSILVSPGYAVAQSDRIEWDHWGVPHIQASSNEGLAYATGWAQMRSNANVLLSLMARARGRAAETPGHADTQIALDQDRWVRTMGVPGIARAWLAAQTPDELAALNGFADGINAYAAAHPDQINPELRALLPVRPVDVLARLAHLMLFDFAVSPQVLASDVDAWRGDTTAMLAAGDGQRGSNAIAIAPAKTGGDALLLANPHLPWSDMNRWFEFETCSPNGEFYGAGMLGLPVQVIGFSLTHGWTHTVNPMHSFYLYQIKLKGDGYLLDGEYTPFETHVEAIRVSRPDGTFEVENLTVRNSVFGPVVATKGGKALALWVSGRDAPHMLEQYANMARAKDFDAFHAALAAEQIPLFSVIYADFNGRIAYYFGGRNPAGGDERFRGEKIIDGTRRAALWDGVLPLDSLPHLVDPATGWVQNANDPPWTSTWPGELSPRDWRDWLVTTRFVNLRAQRIVSIMMGNALMDFDGLVTLKHDTHSELADRVLTDLIDAGLRSHDPDANLGAQVLAGWDRTLGIDRAGAPLFLQWVRLMPDADDVFATQFDPSQPLRGPRGLASPDAAALQLANAVRALRQAGLAADVKWGDVFKLPGTAMLPAPGGPDPLGVIRATYFEPIHGSNLFVATSGDSFVAVTRFGAMPRAMALLGYGNFTEKPLPNVRDQMPFYSRNRLREVLRMPLPDADVVLKEDLPARRNNPESALSTR